MKPHAVKYLHQLSFDSIIHWLKPSDIHCFHKLLRRNFRLNDIICFYYGCINALIITGKLNIQVDIACTILTLRRNIVNVLRRPEHQQSGCHDVLAQYSQLHCTGAQQQQRCGSNHTQVELITYNPTLQLFNFHPSHIKSTPPFNLISS